VHIHTDRRVLGDGTARPLRAYGVAGDSTAGTLPTCCFLDAVGAL